MADYRASGTFSVKRLRTGQTVYLTLNTSGGALFQTVSEDGSSVNPDWKNNEEMRPIVTPDAATGTNQADISNGEWYYNGTLLVFDGDTMGNYVKDTVTGKFACDPSTYALTIIDNLASADNYSNDTLEFRCTVTYDGVSAEMSKSIAVTIMRASATSIYGFLQGDNLLTEEDTTSTLIGTVISGGSYTDIFSAQLYKGAIGDNYKVGTLQSTTSGYVSWEITRENVDGTALFLAQFYTGGDTSNPVATAGIMITDAADPYEMVLMTVGSQTEITDSESVVVVRAQLADKYGTTGHTMDSVTLQVLDPNLEPISGATSTGENVTQCDINVYGSYSTNNNDVIVIGDCEYTI